MNIAKGITLGLLLVLSMSLVSAEVILNDGQTSSMQNSQATTNMQKNNAPYYNDPYGTNQQTNYYNDPFGNNTNNTTNYRYGINQQTNYYNDPFGNNTNNTTNNGYGMNQNNQNYPYGTNQQTNNNNMYGTNQNYNPFGSTKNTHRNMGGKIILQTQSGSSTAFDGVVILNENNTMGNNTGNNTDTEWVVTISDELNRRVSGRADTTILVVVE